MTAFDPVRAVGQLPFDRMVALRRALHRHPELSWREHETAAHIVAALDAVGLSARTGVGGTGVVADIPGARALFVALRADMDALPIHEETNLPYASVTDGVMHACGHDAHVAMLLGAAELLVRDGGLPAPVRFIFQPAEETGSGAPSLIEAGVLKDVGMIFGGHVDRLYAAGEVMVTDGTVNASTDAFTIVLSGPGGHAGRPHETIDLVVTAARLVDRLTAVVARELGSDGAGVVTVAQMHAGTAANVIPTTATLDGTIRALTRESRSILCAAVEREAEAAGTDSGAGVQVTLAQGTPPVTNEGEAVRLAAAAVSEALGTPPVAPAEQNMGGEDFGFYLEHVPGCFVRFGARPAGTSYPAHSSRFVIDESVLAAGAVYFSAVARAAGEVLAARA